MSRFPAAPLALGAVLACALQAQAQPQTTLHLAKVRLYETGVGYFERTGPLPPTGVGLPVPVGHLDDALKTLVILDADGATTVSGIRFPSSVSRELGRALAGLPEGNETPLSIGQLLEHLEGAAVEIRLERGSLRGRVVDVVAGEASGIERCAPGTVSPDAPCTLRQEPAVTVLAENGELRRLPVADVVGVRPLDAALRSRLDAALDAVTEGGSRSRRWLDVAATGGRALTLGYIAEAPVWRSTYRLVLGDAGRAGLQGWALVHNDTDEAWKQVRLELVNGQPDSFLFPLAAPRYLPRELVAPDVELSTVPQLLDRTADGMLWADDIGEAFGVGGLGLSGSGAGGGGRGEGIGLGSIGTFGHGAGADSSSVVSVGSLASLAPAEGAEAGAIFEYVVGVPLDLGPRHSAIVPFLSETLDAERIAWFDTPGAVARAAVHLTNGTKQTLPAGTLAVFADGGFAGESMLARTKPREERIMRFGNDLDVELTEARHSETRTPRALGLQSDVWSIAEHYLSRQQLHYTLVNRSSSARVVYLELDYQDNARVSGADRLGFDSERGRAQAVFTVGPHATLQKTLVVEQGLVELHPIDGLGEDWFEEMGRRKTLPGTTRRVLSEVVRLRAARSAAGERRDDVRERIEGREADLVRLRTSLDTLSGTRGRAKRRVAARIEHVESEIEALAREARQLEAEVKRLAVAERLTLTRLPATPATPATR